MSCFLRYSEKRKEALFMKYEWRRQEKQLYGAKTTPALVTVPTQSCIMINGEGNPNDTDFSNRVSALYSVAYAVKMAYKKTAKGEYDDFAVYPLEGVWQKIENCELIKEKLRYTLVIRQPDFVTEDLVKEALEDIHYRGGKDAAALYFRINPDSHFFSGKGLILGGSHSPNLNSNHSLVGDLSAILIQNVNPLINFIRVPSKKIALMSEWETKIEAIANSTIPVNVTSLSGVPSWMLVLIKRILEKTGKQALEEVWPNLEVFFHGGVAFTPYREQYKQVITTPKMHYVETYNASEGYFGTQNDLSDPAMLLMIDYGIFYEFVPLEEVGKENPRAYCLEEVELNKNYAMVISTSCGLWRYMIGDTVKFTSKNPYKFVITGRTKHFINAFGEELIVDNAEKGLAKACAETGAQICEYSAAPVFMDENAKCRHQWLIEFAKMPDSVEKFAAILDATLKEVNSDYEAKRWKDIALQPLEVIVARQGLFHDWLAQKGKLGGQHKVPRLSNTREYIEAMLVLNNSAHPEE